MKSKWFPAVLILGCAIFSPAYAQELKEGRDDDGIGRFGEKLGVAVERLVDQVTSRWNDPEVCDEDVAEQDSLKKRVRPVMEMDDLERESNTHTYSASTTVDDSEVVEGNIVVKGADLTVRGKVDGDVLVVGGNLYMKGEGVVTGNARVINGDIVKDEKGRIEGYESRSRGHSAVNRERGRGFLRRGRTFDVPWLPEYSDLNDVVFRYNRVEGVFLGAGAEKKYYWDGSRSWSLYGSAGYGFRSHTWRGNFGISRQFSLRTDEGNEMLELGAEGYSLTDTKDQWVITPTENSLSAFLLHEDFRDWFQREGYTVHAAYYGVHEYTRWETKVAWLADSYESLRNNVDWALFGGGKWFRLNPAIQPGRMRSVLVSFGLTTVSRGVEGPEGWTITGSGEVAKKQFGSEFDFEQYIGDIRRFQPLGEYENLNLRVRVGTGSGAFPAQKAFDLGGLGSLNGYPYKLFSGNRLLLGNAEFIVNGGFFDDFDFWPTWFFRHFNFLLLADAGLVRTVAPIESPTTGFRDIGWSDFRSDLGVAFSNRSGSFRIGVTWRTDKREAGRLLLRIERPF